MVNHEFTIDVFKDRRVARRIRKQKMQARPKTIRQWRSNDGKWRIGHRCNRLPHCCEIVEEVLCPSANGKGGLSRLGCINPFGFL